MKRSIITTAMLLAMALTSCTVKTNNALIRTTDGRAYYRHYQASNAPGTYMSTGIEYCENKSTGIECQDLKINLKEPE